QYLLPFLEDDDYVAPGVPLPEAPEPPAEAELLARLESDTGVSATHESWMLGTWADQSGKANDFDGDGSGATHPYPYAEGLGEGAVQSIHCPDWATTWLLKGGVPLALPA